MMNQSQELYPSTQAAETKSHLQRGRRYWLSKHWRWWVVVACLTALFAIAGILIHIEPPFYQARIAVVDGEKQAQLSKQ
jgi:hypothetical protein